jgi:hypothetical protein
METSVIMYRDLNGVKVRQDSKTMFFNANDLLDLYNSNSGEQKRLQNYLDNQATKDTETAILKEIQNNSNESEFENGVIKTKRGKNGGTWMHPYLFIDFGMWLSADFKVTVIKWFYDNLIQLRNEAGDSFKDVNKALIDKYPNKAHFQFANEANMINKLVFGKADKGQRNEATERQLALLKALQKVDVTLIQDGLDYYERYEKLKEYRNAFNLMN